MVTRSKRATRLIEHLFDRFPLLHDALRALLMGDRQQRYELWVAEYDTLGEPDVAAIRAARGSFDDAPSFAFLLCRTQGNGAMLADAEHSLRGQEYDRWNVHYVGATDPESAQPASDTWKVALHAARSDFVVFLDPSISLRPHALFLVACTIKRYPDASLIYADEDVLDKTGSRSNHYFKPDWNEALLRAQNYLGGFVAVRRSLALESMDALREGDEDSLWGFFLKLTATVPPETIHHLPFVLSHRRAQPTPASGQQRRRTSRALEHRLRSLGERAQVEPVGTASYHTRYALPEKPPTVTIVVPSTCDLRFLRPCLDGLLKSTSYPDFDVLLIANGLSGETREPRRYLDELSEDPRVRVLFENEAPYNFSRTNNRAVEHIEGPLVCFLNDDTKVINPHWLSSMVAHALQERVAAVGAKLLYPNGRIQHAGVILGVGHVAGQAHSRWRRSTSGYHERLLVSHDVSCVTAACMLIRRDVFLEFGGFDEAFPIAFNDIDLCLRLRQQGWRILWTPGAELYHHESASTGRHDAEARKEEWARELQLVHGRWAPALQSDPHYNPNLSLDPFYLWEPSFPPRISYPWRQVGGPEIAPAPSPVAPTRARAI